MTPNLKTNGGTMSENYRKISDKEYEVLLDNRTVSVIVPFGKVKALVKEFAGTGGMIDPQTGMVKTDLITLVEQSGNLGTILLSKYDEKGKPEEEITCEGYAYSDVLKVFRLAQEIIGNFIQAALVDGTQEAAQSPNSENIKEGKKAKVKS